MGGAGDAEDRVVLLDADFRPVGSAPRESVHGVDTPLHLAFSCWLFDDQGQMLLTRRALTKRSWPGVWTNSFCGHPRPGEDLPQAVQRCGDGELGVRVGDVTELLPDFHYRAVDPQGVVEHEFCPVFTARTHDEVVPDPDEAVEHRWVPLDEVRSALAVAPWALSPWLVEQARLLGEAGRWAQVETFARSGGASA